MSITPQYVSLSLGAKMKALDPGVTCTLSSYNCVLYSDSDKCQIIHQHIPIQTNCFELFSVMKRRSSYGYFYVIDSTWHIHNLLLQNQIIAKKKCLRNYYTKHKMFKEDTKHSGVRLGEFSGFHWLSNMWS